MNAGIDDQDRRGISPESTGRDEQDATGGTILSSNLPETINQQQPTDKKDAQLEQTPQRQETNVKATYAEKTDRIQLARSKIFPSQQP